MERCTCTKKDAAAILAAAEIMYKKKYNKFPSKNTCTKEHAEIILDAATMMYQKKYNKFSKSDVYKLKEELDIVKKKFKEDNIKTIDNILQSQGINTNNSNEIEKEVGNQSAKNLSYKDQNTNKLFGISQKKDSSKNSNTNLFGIPPKKETQPPQTTKSSANNLFGLPSKKESASNPNINQNKPNISNTTKTNLFGNPAPKNTGAKPNNLFGNPNTNNSKQSNLF